MNEFSITEDPAVVDPQIKDHFPLSSRARRPAASGRAAAHAR